MTMGAVAIREPSKSDTFHDVMPQIPLCCYVSAPLCLVANMLTSILFPGLWMRTVRFVYQVNNPGSVLFTAVGRESCVYVLICTECIEH